VLEAVRERPVPVVMASSSSVYGEAVSQPAGEDEPLRPISPYGVTKLAAEHLALLYAREHGLCATALRYFTVYGPRQRPDMAISRFLRAALAGDPLHLLGDGEQTRDFTYVDDAVDATVRALHGVDAAYNVGGGNVSTVREVIALIEDLVGRPVAVSLSAHAAGDVGHTWADTTRARAGLGWGPRTSLREGLRRQLDWIRTTQHPPAAVTTAP
jgi:nucleoside-diphosphate-sugar epimerase